MQVVASVIQIRKGHKYDPFDLTDPEALQFSNEYQSLHDPHLKSYLGRPLMKYRLVKGGFITCDGKVLCTLREYNEYRRYLRRQELECEAIYRRQLVSCRFFLNDL